MITAELLRSQLEYAILQVAALETQIGTNDFTVPTPILRRLQDQFRDLAASLRIAVELRA